MRILFTLGILFFSVLPVWSQCEIDFDFTIGAFDNNGTIDDCSDDISEIIIATPTLMGENSGTIQVLIDGNVAYTGFSTTLTLAFPADGQTHTVSARDAEDNTCSKTKFIPAQGVINAEIQINYDFNETPSDCNDDVFWVSCIPTTEMEFSSVWTAVDSYGATYTGSYGEETIFGSYAFFSETDLTITISDTLFLDCQRTITIEVPQYLPSAVECNLLSGFVFNSTSCMVDSSEIPLDGWMVEIRGDDYLEYRSSDSDGYYSIYLPMGEFTVSLIPVSLAWNTCVSEQNINFGGSGETLELDLFAKAIDDCPLLEVSINITSNLRPCWDNRVIYVNYQNVGTDTLFDGLIAVVLPDELNYSHTSSDDFLSQEGDTLFFAAMSPLAPGAVQNFRVYVDVDCDASLGAALCVRALGLPYGPCPEADELWLGASLQVRGECAGDEVLFYIRNIGNNMTNGQGAFIIVEDGVMLKGAPDLFPPLDEGEELVVGYPANGVTYRLELMQESNHPGFSQPMAVIEGCGINNEGSFSMGHVQQLWLDDRDYYIDEDCRLVTNAFDSNNNQAEPLGYAEPHYIEKDQELEYTIRFQNTGTDTAFTVVLRDTLSDWLDMRSLHAGVSSHPYRLQLDSARAISFVFDDILLPDSTTNFEASQGFVEFKVSPLVNVPLETIVENTAAIYFDFNAPVITNTTYHTLGRDFIEMLTWTSSLTDDQYWKIFPNPIHEQINIIQKGNVEDAVFILYDALGRTKKQVVLSTYETTFDVSDLASGWYSFQLIAVNGHLIGSGSLVKK